MRFAFQPTPMIIVADDFGLCSSYDAGIMEAASAGAIDAASVIVGRGGGRIGELLATGVAVGLHLEGRGAGEVLDEQGLRAQLVAFERIAGRPPDHLDGHHHCHARAAAAPIVAAAAAALDLPVRSVDPDHRRLLRAAGARTPDLLVGRYEDEGLPVPAELREPPAGVRFVEWMTHPGHPDPSCGSSYDRGRGEDLEVLLGFEAREGIVRGSWPDLPRG